MLSGITMLSGILQVLDCCLSFVAGTVPTLATCNCPAPRATRTAQYATCNAGHATQPQRPSAPLRRRWQCGAAAVPLQLQLLQPSATAGAIAAQRATAPRRCRAGEIALRWVVGRRRLPTMLPCLAVQSEEWENGDAGGFVCYMADEVGARVRPSVPRRMVSRAAWSAAHATCSMFGS